MLKIGYARVSTQRDEQKTSIENQKAKLLEVGVLPDDLYVDAGKSGKDIEGRPAFQACIEACLSAVESREEVTLYLCNDERLGRGLIDDLTTIQLLDRAGVVVFDLLGNKRITLEGDSFLLTAIERVVSANSRLKTKRAVQSVYDSKRRAGKPLMSHKIWGYWLNADSRLEIDPDLRAPMRQLIEWALEGLPLAEIAQRIDEGQLGVTWPRNKPRDGSPLKRGISPSRVRNWLKSPILRGHIGLYSPDGRKLLGIAHHGAHEAIMTTGEYRQIENRLRTNAENSRRWHTKNHPLSSRYLRCGACGAPAYIKKSPRTDINWVRCSNTKGCEHSKGTDANVILQAIDAKLVSQAQQLSSGLVGTLAPDPELQQQILRLERRREQAAIMAEQLGTPGIKADLEAIEAELRSLRGQASQPVIDQEEYRELLQFFQEPGWLLEQDDLYEIYDVLNILVRRVTFLDGAVTGVVTIWG